MKARKQKPVEFMSRSEIINRRNRKAAAIAGFFAGFGSGILILVLWWWAAWR